LQTSVDALIAALRPNRAKISELLNRIADGVSTATSLTAAVANLQIV
jgi:hypothetical protein